MKLQTGLAAAVAVVALGCGSAAKPSYGTLWVTSRSNSVLSGFTSAQLAASGTVVPDRSIGPEGHYSLSDVEAMVADANGDLWVGTCNSNAALLSRFSPADVIAGNQIPKTQLLDLFDEVGCVEAMVFDADGNLWIASDDSLFRVPAAELQTGGIVSPDVEIDSVSTAYGYSLDEAEGIVFDGSGDLWVANYDDNTLSEFTPQQLAVSGAPVPAVQITSPDLARPWGITFDGSGNLWVSNYAGQSVLKYTASQLISSGAKGATITLNGALDSDSDLIALRYPRYLTFDGSGNLWVMEYYQLDQYTPSQLTSSGSPLPVYQEDRSISGTGLYFPYYGQGPVFQGSDAWFVSDGALMKFPSADIETPGAVPTAFVGTTLRSLADPRGAAFDGSGNLWVADCDNDTLVSFGGDALTQTAGAPVPRVIIGGTTGTSYLYCPWSLAFDPHGNLWVGNLDRRSIVKYSPAQLAQSGNPRPASLLTDDGSDQLLEEPEGLAFDQGGNLWVLDTDLRRLSRYGAAELDAPGDQIPDVLITDGSSPVLAYASSLAFDSKGNLWVGSTSPGVRLARYVPGQLSQTGSPNPSPTITTLALAPNGLVFDGNDNLWVASGESALLRFSASQLAQGGAVFPEIDIESPNAELFRAPYGLAFAPGNE